MMKHFEIIDSYYKRARRSNRYGIHLILRDIESNSGYFKYTQTIWLGNFKNFQKDSNFKSNKIFFMATKFFNAIGFDLNVIETPEKLIGIRFDANTTEAGEIIRIC